MHAIRHTIFLLSFSLSFIFSFYIKKFLRFVRNTDIPIINLHNFDEILNNDELVFMIISKHKNLCWE